MAKSSSIPQRSRQIHPATPVAGREAALIGLALLDWKIWLKALVIIAAGLWVYWPVLRGDWLWDDDTLITDNHLIHDPAGLWKIWFNPTDLFDYLPLKVSVEWLEWHLWGKETLGYHLVNLGLHLAGAFLVWRLLAKFGLKFAWLGGLIFVVHPVMVESVAWISELKNTLSLPPFLWAICAYIDYEERGRKQDYFLSLALFLAAMLGKATMVMFPLVILLYAWWRRGRIGRGDLKASAPFFAISLAIGLITIWFLQQHAMVDEAPKLGGFLSRLACAGLAISFYFAKCVLPIGLMPIYPQWNLDPPSVLQFLPWPTLAGVIAWLWTRRIGWGRHALLGLGFFLINLLPFVGFTAGAYMSFTWVMDHILYIPLIGLIGLFVAGMGHLHATLPPTASRVGAGIVASLLALLAWESHGYAGIFVNQETLWSYELQVNPQAWPAYNNLGAILLLKDRVSDALPLFEEALNLNPDYVEAHYNRALALGRLNRDEEAIEELEKALHLAPDNINVRFELGRELSRVGRIPAAIEQYQIGLGQYPDMVEARAELGRLLLQSGRFSEAVDAFKQVTQDCPGAAAPHNDLGNALYVMGQHDRAMDEYREAMRLDPGSVEAHNNLAGAMQYDGHLDEAIKEFQVALGMDPTSPNLHINLARALAQGGRKEEAIKEYETALRLDPESAEAKAELAALRGPAAGKPPKK